MTPPSWRGRREEVGGRHLGVVRAGGESAPRPDAPLGSSASNGSGSSGHESMLLSSCWSSFRPLLPAAGAR